MDRNEYLEREIDATLDSFEGVGRATPNAYFYVRLKARMERQNERGARAYALSVRWVVASLVICLAINFLVIYEMENAAKESTYAASQTQVDGFAKDYGLRASPAYDLK